MIEPKDLRIGNFIQDEENEIFKVDSISENEIRAGAMTVYPLGFEVVKGIPLSPEWLERMGFVQKVPMQAQLCWFNNGVMVDDRVYYIDNKYRFPYRDDTVKLEYVNQLQNLFYFLTGQELTIKP